LPDEARDFSCAIAEKSLVNDVADSVGAAALEVAAALDVAALLDVAAGAAALLLLELFELPQAASARLAPTASTAATALPLRKCMNSPPPSI
jgi:hypothetical protein